MNGGKEEKQTEENKSFSLSVEAISVAFILPSDRSEGEKRGPGD